jgi:pimeloyl-ACP methyl ester carboxylesterase
MYYPDDTAKNLGLRIITPDRPGFGLSDFQPHRKLMDLPDDLVQLADHLQIGTFSIFGVSAGGIYILPCAYKIPERLEKVAILNGAVPIDLLADPYQGMSEKFKKVYVMTAKFPFWLLRFVTWIAKRKIAKDPEAAYQNSLGFHTEANQKFLLDPTVKAWKMGHDSEVYRQGTKGVAQEGKILVSPSGPNPAEIKKHIDLWYFEDDPLVPMQWGKYLASVLPNNTTHFFPDGGHYAVWVRWGEVLRSIAGK